MSGVTPQSRSLLVLVVSDDAGLRQRTLETLAVQSPPLDVRESTWAELPEHVTSAAAEWIAVLPEGAEPAADWGARLAEHLSEASLGVVGGRVLEFFGAQMQTSWYDPGARLAYVDWQAQECSRLSDFPDSPVVADVEFLRADNMAARREIVVACMSDELPLFRDTLEPHVCFAATRAGLRVICDSSVVVCHRHVWIAPCAPDPKTWELEGARHMAVLKAIPGRGRSAWLVCYSLLVGTRSSPGVAMGLLYAWWPARRARWNLFVRGKIRALVGS